MTDSIRIDLANFRQATRGIQSRIERLVGGAVQVGPIYLLVGDRCLTVQAEYSQDGHGPLYWTLEL